MNAVPQRVETGLEAGLDTVTMPRTEAERLEHVLAQLRAIVPTLGAGDAAKLAAAAGPADPNLLQPGNSRKRKPAATQEPNMATTAPATPTGNLSHSPSNQISFQDLLDLATESGKLEAQGVDSLPKFMLKVAEAAFVGAIDNTANKHGNGIDDATRLTAERVKARNSTNIFDRKALKQRVACNRTRTMIKLGMWPKGGPGEPLSTLNRTLTLRDKFSKDASKQKRVIDATNTMLNFARVQLKSDHTLTDVEIEQAILKPEHEKPTEEMVLESIRKKMQASKVGNGMDGMVDGDTADKIIANVTKRLKAIAAAKAPNATQAAPAASAAA